jgi:hypothetical protein
LAVSLVAIPPHQQAFAAACTVTSTTDGRPYIAPTASGVGSGKKLGFDNTHGETAGGADWVIDGGYKDMACALAGQGYAVEEIRAYPLGTAILNQYDAVVIPEPNIPFTTAEEAALVSFVGAGHGLLMVGDHYQADRNYNTWDATEVFSGWRRGHYQVAFSSPYYWYNGTATSSSYAFNNEDDWMATNFGMRFHFNAMDMATGVTGFTAGNPADPDDPGVLAADQTFNITSGVTSVATHAGATLAIVDATKAMGIIFPNKGSIVKWSSAQATDPIAIYTDSVGTPACGSATNGGRCEGPYVAIAKPSAGKVAAVGDSSAFDTAVPKYKREDNGATKTTYNGWGEVNNSALGINLVNWLATSDPTVGIPAAQQQQVSPEPYDVFTISEPLVEPWSAGPAGYHWYDARTFSAGSYNNTTLYGIPDTTAPTVSITAPAGGATVSGTTTVSASASDDVGVTKVEFYLDSVLQSTVTVSPYNWSWNTATAANGSHSLIAKAYDAAANVGTSTTVTVTVANAADTTAPTVSITAPAGGATVSGTTTVSASASDDVGVTKVEFYLDSVLQSTVTASPYNWSWNTTTAANGSHSLIAKAYDAAANVGTSTTVTVTVSNTGTSTASETFTGTLSSSPTTKDFWIDVTATGTISLNLSWSGTAGLNLYLYNPSGTQVANAQGKPSPVTLSYNATTTGRYKIHVTRSSGTADFTLTESHPINPNVTSAYNQSGSLSAGGNQTYTLTAGGTGTIDLSVSFPTGSDFDLYLINSAGSTVASTTSRTLNPESISYQVSGAGTYTVKVQSYSGSGAYTLSGYYPK